MRKIYRFSESRDVTKAKETLLLPWDCRYRHKESPDSVYYPHPGKSGIHPSESGAAPRCHRLRLGRRYRLMRPRHRASRDRQRTRPRDRSLDSSFKPTQIIRKKISITRILTGKPGEKRKPMTGRTRRPWKIRHFILFCRKARSGKQRTAGEKRRRGLPVKMVRIGMWVAGEIGERWNFKKKKKKK